MISSIAQFMNRPVNRQFITSESVFVIQILYFAA